LTKKIGAQGEHHDRATLSDAGRIQYVINQSSALVLVIAQRKDFFELIDQDKEPMRFRPRMEGETCRKVKASLFILRTRDKRRNGG